MRTDVISDLRIPSDWGLEIGVLSEMHRNYATNRLCQVDIADVYDHKHQDLSQQDDQYAQSKLVSEPLEYWIRAWDSGKPATSHSAA